MKREDIRTVEDVQKAIEEQAGVGLENGDVPVADACGWFDKTLARAKPIPFGGKYQRLLAFAMFHDAEEIRVYALQPVAGQSAAAEGLPPHRFTLSKTANVMVTEILELDSFIDEIADELQLLARIDHALALAEAAKHLFTTGNPKPLQDAIADYEGEDEEEDEDDEDEEDEETATDGAVRGVENPPVEPAS